MDLRKAMMVSASPKFSQLSDQQLGCRRFAGRPHEGVGRMRLAMATIACVEFLSEGFRHNKYAIDKPTRCLENPFHHGGYFPPRLPTNNTVNRHPMMSRMAEGYFSNVQRKNKTVNCIVKLL